MEHVCLYSDYNLIIEKIGWIWEANWSSCWKNVRRSETKRIKEIIIIRLVKEDWGRNILEIIDVI
jgi:hypothetical protein